MIPVKVQGEEATALVDTGCGQTLIEEGLVSDPEQWGPPVRMQCIHGDVRTYPTAKVKLAIGSHEELCRVGVVPRLAYPVVLGRDWPYFWALLRGHPGKGGPEQPQAALTGQRTEEDPGEGTSRGARRGAIRSPGIDAPPIDTQAADIALDGDFLEEQRNDPTLSRAWEQTGGPEPTDLPPPERPQGPRFEVRGDLLYCLTQDPQTQAEICQLLVPQRFRMAVMRLAHDVPWAGHLGREKTLCRLAQRFFWPGVHHAVRDYCASCPECQRANPSGVPRAPLVPLPVVGTPFERVGLDLVGPLERSTNKNK